jgi:hypothetical protein
MVDNNKLKSKPFSMLLQNIISKNIQSGKLSYLKNNDFLILPKMIYHYFQKDASSLILFKKFELILKPCLSIFQVTINLIFRHFSLHFPVQILGFLPTFYQHLL